MWYEEWGLDCWVDEVFDWSLEALTFSQVLIYRRDLIDFCGIAQLTSFLGN